MSVESNLIILKPSYILVELGLIIFKPSYESVGSGWPSVKFNMKISGCDEARN